MDSSRRDRAAGCEKYSGECYTVRPGGSVCHQVGVENTEGPHPVQHPLNLVQADQGPDPDAIDAARPLTISHGDDFADALSLELLLQPRGVAGVGERADLQPRKGQGIREVVTV